MVRGSFSSPPAQERAVSMGLLQEWEQWKPSGVPFALAADESVFGSGRSARAIINRTSWASAYRATDYCAPGDRSLHLGLLPQPFFGDLRRATIDILLLNPGLGPTDYYGEYKVAAYRKALLNNLKQRFLKGASPFLFLDPAFSWHGGFGWWHAKLGGVIQRLADEWTVTFAQARHRLSQQLASIELVPYHSPSVRDAGGWIRQLHSVRLARAFVHDTVVPRVRNGEAILIVTRQANAWDLPRHRGIVRYSGQQARAAHLSPESPGGRAILRHMA